MDASSLMRTQFFRHVAQTSDAPPAVAFIAASGCKLTGADGREYIDLISGISVNNLGHHHPEVIAAIHHQVDKYLHLMVYGEFILSPQVEYATRLASVLPTNLSSVYFTNSGSEAIEGAMKLSKRFTGRTQIASCFNAYHGSTQGALSITGDTNMQQNYRPLLPDILHLRFNSIDDLSLITERTASFILEPIQAEAGCKLPDEGYLQAVRERCNTTGTLMILDEIQTGMGRTGTRFAFETSGIVPDILVTGKAFGGGMPLGAFISSNAIMNSLTNNPVLGHITTFGGHPVCCAAGLAAFNVIEREDLAHQTFLKEQLFRKLLQHKTIRSIHGKGLLLAVEFDSNERMQGTIANCLKNGLVSDWFLFAPNCLRIAPPLIISEQEITEACQIILSSIPN